MEDYIDIKHQDFSFLGKNSAIKGEFSFVGNTRIASRLEGELKMENKADLCIERTATFKGTINCHNAEIFGQFEGTLKASGKITIYPSSNVSGEISAKNLIIHPGATLNIDGHTC